jgi:hypothetical protein
MDTHNWQPPTLAALRAAFPAHRWERDGAMLSGYVPAGARLHPISITRDPTDDGWFRAEVFIGNDPEGMDPSDPVRAVRVALRRAGLGA